MSESLDFNPAQMCIRDRLQGGADGGTGARRYDPQRDRLQRCLLYTSTFGLQFNAAALGKQWRYEAYT